MQILKKNIHINPNILKDIKNINTIKKITFLSKILSITEDFDFIMEYDNKLNMLYPEFLNISNNSFFFFYKKYYEDYLTLPIKSVYIYKLYYRHFFNFIITKKIKILKGRIIGYKRNVDSFYISFNGLIIPIKKNYLINRSKRKYNNKVWKKIFKSLKKKHLLFFSKKIKWYKKNLKIHVSRKKILKILQKKRYATI